MKIHWIRVIVFAVLYEVALIALTVVVLSITTMDAFVPFVGPVCFAVGFPFGMWTARKATSGFVLHGLLMAIVASIIYFALVLGSSGGSLTPVIETYGPLWFVAGNALKILGIVAGAYAAGSGRESLD
jgi:hypothetical protein